ncbi:DUF397 domain-containing protein [Micromonospora endolithica]|uniref:DUF397 domain-containing protein n=1 Tax=Micromonospora endolithica TaxID=230091 RepID=UPI003B50B489
MTCRKSTRSPNENAQCVEVALTPYPVGVRDSKEPCGPVLVVAASRWSAFVDATRTLRTDLAP